MKNTLKVLGAVLLIGAWIFFDAKSDYAWSELIINKKTSEGWTLAAKRESGDFALTWTWFKLPVTGLWFTKPEQTRHLGSVVIAPILSVSYEHSITEQQEYVELFDLASGKTAILPGNSPIEMAQFSKLKWSDFRHFPSGTPGDQLVKYIQNTKATR